MVLWVPVGLDGVGCFPVRSPCDILDLSLVTHIYAMLTLSLYMQDHSVLTCTGTSLFCLELPSFLGYAIA
jgi:hypothetical protein